MLIRMICRTTLFQLESGAYIATAFDEMLFISLQCATISSSRKVSTTNSLSRYFKTSSGIHSRTSYPSCILYNHHFYTCVVDIPKLYILFEPFIYSAVKTLSVCWDPPRESVKQPTIRDIITNARSRVFLRCRLSINGGLCDA